MTGAGDGRAADIDFSDGAVRDRLRAFLTTEALIEPTDTLRDDTPLLRGRLDSTGLMLLLTFVEDEFGLELAYEDIDERNFGSIDRLAGLIIAKSTSR